MVWKVFHIQSGDIIKAGFEDDEAAQAWLDKISEAEDNSFDIEEMDEDEWVDYQDSIDKLRDSGEIEDDHDLERRSVTLAREFLDSEDSELSDDDFLTPIEDED